jgi:hypothetical protein
LAQTSFGLTSNDKENVILEPFFLLGYYFGMDWNTYYNFPVAYKRWLIKRIEKEIQAAHNQGNDIPSKAIHQNTPEARAWAGRNRTTVPSKLTRFT